MTSFHTVKLFDLAEAPSDVAEAARAMGGAFAGDVGENTVWEVCVGTCEWESVEPRNGVERHAADGERRLHGWLTENGARPGETVIVRVDAF